MSFHKNPWLDQHWHEHQRNILEYLPILNLKDVAITCLCKYTLLFGISILWWSLFGSAQIVVRMAKLCKTNKDLWTLCWFWWSAETVRWPKRKVLIFWCPKRARWKKLCLHLILQGVPSGFPLHWMLLCRQQAFSAYRSLAGAQYEICPYWWKNIEKYLARRTSHLRVFVGQICQDAIIRWSTILASPKFPIAPPAPPSCFIFNAK